MNNEGLCQCGCDFTIHANQLEISQNENYGTYLKWEKFPQLYKPVNSNPKIQVCAFGPSFQQLF